MKYWSKSWSLISGCTPVSPACENCWLRAMDKRFGKAWDGNVICREDRLDLPLKTKKPTTWAIWSDLFHPQVPADFIIEVFERMEYCKQHTFLICTKRSRNMSNFISEWLETKPVLNNCFLATTVENQEMANKRIPELLKCKPFKLFLSAEPLLSEIKISHEHLKQIDYVICGCES